MKNAVLLLSACILLSSCGGRNESTSSSSDHTAADHTTSVPDSGSSAVSTANDASGAARGAQLITSSDCASCHQDREKLIGPSYADIAGKYENTDGNQKMLAGKIIKGGAGNWGEISMTPHPAISESDAVEMVKYIFSLK